MKDDHVQAPKAGRLVGQRCLSGPRPQFEECSAAGACISNERWPVAAGLGQP
jgi:hypothetical protein